MPLGSLGPVIDALGLVEPIDRVGQGVVERVSHDGNTGCRADLIQTLGGTHGGELRTGIGARREADEALGTSGTFLASTLSLFSGLPEVSFK